MDFVKQLEAVWKNEKDLPTLPDVILELRSALDRDDVGGQEIAEIVSRDPIITAKLLRVANSAAFNRGNEISSVMGAVQRVGMREVRCLCVVLGVVESFANHQGNLDLEEFWDHSAAVGRVAQLLAKRVECGPGADPDDIYVAGLLHDVGLLLLDQFFPDRLRGVCTQSVVTGVPLWRAERSELGLDHAAVGAMLTERWSLPASVTQCIAGHHEISAVDEEYVGAAAIIRAAEILCTSLGAGIVVEGAVEDDAFSTMVDLGMADDKIDAFLTEIEEIGLSMRGVLAA